MAVKTKNTKNVNQHQLIVTQIGSMIGQKKDQIQTLIGLGLGKMSRTKLLSDTPSIRGMINKVKHLVDVKINEK